MSKGRHSTVIYMLTTNDHLELPLFIGTLNECVKYSGVSKEILYDMAYNHRRNENRGWNAWLPCRIFYVEDMEEEYELTEN